MNTPQKIRQNTRTSNVSHYSRELLDIFSFKMEITREFWLKNLPPGTLVVSNHLSFWDVVILASIAPLTFVTSNEVKEHRGLGFLARLAGCIFVERRNRRHLQKDIEKISRHLGSGHSIAIFPEGTSSNGAELLPFKSSLFKAVERVHAPVLPVCINYLTIDGLPINASTINQVTYYGDQSFITQIKNCLRLSEIGVKLEIGYPVPKQRDHQINYKEICKTARHEVATRFIPVQS